MPTYAITFGAAYDRDKGESAGLVDRGASATRIERQLVVAAFPDNLLLGASLDRFAAEVLSIHVRVTAGTGTLVELWARLGDVDWMTVDNAGATLLLDNGGSQCIELSQAMAPNGQLVPVPRILFNGATAIAIGTNVVLDVEYVWRPWGATSRISHARALAFLESSSGDFPPNAPALVARIEAAFATASGGRYRLGLTSGGVPLFVNDVGLALPNPSAVAFIDPGDIGNANEQIPPDYAGNSAQRYAFHPAVFYRVPPFTRAFRTEPVPPWRFAENDEEELELMPIVEPNGALTIFTIQRAPTHSEWFVIVDGVAMQVIIAHPPGTDYRRPRDIWNGVWTQYLQRNAAGDGVPIFQVVQDGMGGQTFATVGRINRLAYLEFAAFVDAYDATAGGMIDFYFQSAPEGPLPPPGPG